MWAAVIASGMAAYGNSRAQESQGRQNQQNQLELLEAAYGIRQREQEDRRNYMREGYEAYAPYGAGGEKDPFAQYRNRTQAGGGLLSRPGGLNPNNFSRGY
jgi:hypothetical protein